MVFLVLHIIIFLVLALLLGTGLGYMLSRSTLRDVRTAAEQLKLDVAASRKRLSANETDLQLHKSSLSELRAAYDGLQERLSVHSDRQADLSGQMEGLVAARSALSERTATLASQLTEAQAGLVRQLDSAQQTLIGRIDDLSTDRDDHAQRLFSLENGPGLPLSGTRPAAFDNVTAKADRGESAGSLVFEERLASLEARLEVAQREAALAFERSASSSRGPRTDDMPADAAAQLASLAGLPHRITSLDENQQDLEARVRALEAISVQVEATRGQFERMQSTTAALTSRLEHQDRWGQEAEDRIGAIESQLARQEPGLEAAQVVSRTSDADLHGAPTADASSADLTAGTPYIVSVDASLPNDNLKRIRGVGVALERTLNDAGIRRFEQIAAWTPQDVSGFAGNLEKFQSRIIRDDWVSQAKALMADDADRAGKGSHAAKPTETTTAEW